MFFMRFGRLIATICFALFALLSASSLFAAPEKTKRVALVIGNSAYRGVDPLTNPANDANDVARKLKALEFDVLLATDADREQMRSMLDEFRSRLTSKHVGLVFYAGHGVTINGESFLLPVDVPSEIEVDETGSVTLETLNARLVSMASVLTPLESARVGIVFLDACRTNAAQPGAGLRVSVVSLGAKRAVPVMRGTGSLQVKASEHSAGVFRAYATQLNNVASDGVARNSPFTAALLKHIETKGISIQELMMRVRKSVMEETKNQQIPWEEAALNDSFYFVPSFGAPPVAATPAKSGPRPSGGTYGTAGAARKPAPSTSRLPPNIGAGVGAGL